MWGPVCDWFGLDIEEDGEITNKTNLERIKNLDKNGMIEEIMKIVEWVDEEKKKICRDTDFLEQYLDTIVE